MLLVAVFAIICLWRIFAKAGQPGWAALIPIYNVYILLKVIGKPAWWLVFIFAGIIPVIGYIIILAWGIIIALELGNKFGKSTVFSIVGLWLFSIVGYPMLAFGSAQYNPSAPPVVNFLSGGSNAAPQSAPQTQAAEQAQPAQPTDQQTPPTV